MSYYREQGFNRLLYGRLLSALFLVIANTIQFAFLNRTVEFGSGAFGCVPFFIVSSITVSLLLISISVMIKRNALLEFIEIKQSVVRWVSLFSIISCWVCCCENNTMSECSGKYNFDFYFI